MAKMKETNGHRSWNAWECYNSLSNSYNDVQHYQNALKEAFEKYPDDLKKARKNFGGAMFRRYSGERTEGGGVYNTMTLRGIIEMLWDSELKYKEESS